MKKYVFLILILFTFSCSKNEFVSEPDYSVFLNNNEFRFNFKGNSNNYNWFFGYKGFQMVADNFQIENDLSVSKFHLISDDGSNYFNLTSPAVNTSDQEAINNLFSIGKKKIGNSTKDFCLTVKIDNELFNPISNSDYELEILKAEKFSDNNEIALRVWFIINNLILENSNQNGNNLEIKDGYMVAKFYNF